MRRVFITGANRGLGLSLVKVALARGDSGRDTEVEPEASHLSIRSIRAESMLRMFEVNTVAPMILTRELLPRICPREGSIIAFLSSGMASISRKDGREREFSYSASKAALNMLVRVLAGELLAEHIAVIALNPGWVATDMGTSAAPLQPDDVAASLVDVLEGIELANSGSFVDYRGQVVPW